MCGIVGIIGSKTVTSRLMAGLRRLEYRGYDSAGLAIAADGAIDRRRAKGKIVNLEAVLTVDPLDGPVGIAHTRWATHGAPSVTNAHPHRAGRVAIVHNGIIENFAEIREKLAHRNLESDTDTEIAAHLIDHEIDQGGTIQDAVGRALAQFRGAYALGILVEDEPHRIYCARRGSPLAVGIGKGERYLGSDAMALAALTDQLIYLEEGDWAVLESDSIQIFDDNGTPVERDITVVRGADDIADKGSFDHFMLKEIHEQPDTLARTLSHYLDLAAMGVSLPEELDLGQINRIVIVACGTAFYAGMVGQYLFEQIAGVAVDIDIASEFRYREPVLDPNSLMIVVSQSGETADTLAALRYAKEAGLKTAALVNVMTSTMAREADVAMPINAGPEIGVASTKAFTSQVAALACLAVGAGELRGKLDSDSVATHVRELMGLPTKVADALKSAAEIATIAGTLAGASSAFFLGRGTMVPIALEGALKLKEISYIHAEGYAAGELKHGPIALIEDGTPVIASAPMDGLFEKTVSNLQEVAARGARVILFTDAEGKAAAGDQVDTCLVLPTAPMISAPIVQAIGQQLLAYHTALALGTDVDQPRNLAKSVTVE